MGKHFSARFPFQTNRDFFDGGLLDDGQIRKSFCHKYKKVILVLHSLISESIFSKY